MQINLQIHGCNCDSSNERITKLEPEGSTSHPSKDDRMTLLEARVAAMEKSMLGIESRVCTLERHVVVPVVQEPFMELTKRVDNLTSRVEKLEDGKGDNGVHGKWEFPEYDQTIADGVEYIYDKTDNNDETKELDDKVEEQQSRDENKEKTSRVMVSEDKLPNMCPVLSTPVPSITANNPLNHSPYHHRPQVETSSRPNKIPRSVSEKGT